MKVLQSLEFVSGKVGAELRRLYRKSKRGIDKLVFPIVHRGRVRRRKADFKTTSQAARFQEGEDSFVLYRIIGNALEPHQEPDQVVRNLAFQLDGEPELRDCRKIWIVNRIFEPTLRDAVISMLADRDAEFFEIPFDLEAYRQIDTQKEDQRIDAFLRQMDSVNADIRNRAELAKLRLKRLYAMNNNGARNAALRDGRDKAKWILPWDGNCFLTEPAWEQIVQDVKASSQIPYHLVYMARVFDNADVLEQTAVPDANHEPQIIFHRESCDLFDEAIPYGRRPKVELLQRIGVAGPWRYWADDPWDIGGGHASPFEYLFSRSSGWVYRLSSGQSGVESGKKADQRRHRNRNEAIRKTVQHLDELAAEASGPRAERPTRIPRAG